MRYRKKPLQVDAVRYQGTDASYLQLVAMLGLQSVEVVQLNHDFSLNVHTLNGVARADIGDWIIKDEGDVYPCKPDRFAERYERVPAKGKATLSTHKTVLRNMRMEKGMDQEQLAMALGRSRCRSTISQAENGYPVHRGWREQLAKFFGVAEDHLFDGDVAREAE